MLDQITPEQLALLLQQQQQQQSQANQTFQSTAARSCTLLEKLNGTWQIISVSPSKGGEKGVNPILTIRQGDTTKRSYTHPSNLPSCTEKDGTFTWSVPKSLTEASTITIKNGDPVFNW